MSNSYYIERRVGDFTIVFNLKNNRHYLCYRDNKIPIFSSAAEYLTTLSKMALCWVIETDRDHEEMITLLSESDDRMSFINHFGDKYKIPDEWYIEAIINNV